MADPKYSRPEIERRWLMDLADVPPGDGEVIEDLYVEGTRLRLRKWTDSSGEIRYKFAKKYGAVARGIEPMTNLYLTATEYELLNQLPGSRVIKRRIPQPKGGAIDLFPDFAVFEIEFRSEEEARSYVPPTYVGREITGDPEMTGQALARRSGSKSST